MNALSATELKVLNNLSQEHNANVELGQEIQDLISGLPKVGTPVNAAGASTELTWSDVVVHGESVTIDNPEVPGSDIYEFLGTVSQEVSVEGNIAVDLTEEADPAEVTLTVDTQPLSGDTFTLGAKEYTFVPVGTDNSDGEVSVGADLAGAQEAIVAAINGSDGHNVPHSLCTAEDFSSNDCVITALIAGVAGNSYASTETFDEATNVFSADVFEDGTDCDEEGIADILSGAFADEDTQGVAAADESGGVMSITAEVPGVAGNDIAVETTCANGTFTGGTEVLEDGVDGTVGSEGQMYIDDDYIYYTDDDNTIVDDFWVRIAVTWATF